MEVIRNWQFVLLQSWKHDNNMQHDFSTKLMKWKQQKEDKYMTKELINIMIWFFSYPKWIKIYQLAMKHF